MDRKIHKTRSRALPAALAAALPALLLSACGGSSDGIAQLAEARPATLLSCTDLAAKISFPNTRITAAETVAAGALAVAGKPIAEHCRVTGRMHERVSTVDGQNYAVGFEMRLPRDWNGRFFYQANGGLDGVVSTAVGALGGGPLGNALQMGFAVLSSDAGHAGSLGPFFGLDPQARLDYGYQAVGKLTPMARSALQTAYGKGPDRSYLGGCSNGGRHAMVAASRYADQYDGIIAGNPARACRWRPLPTLPAPRAMRSWPPRPGPGHGLHPGRAPPGQPGRAGPVRCAGRGHRRHGAGRRSLPGELRPVARCAHLRRCARRQLPQRRAKSTIAGLFKGATTSGGSRIYSSFPYDAGLDTAGWAGWKFSNPISRDSGAVAFIWQTPPESAASFKDAQFALNGSVDSMLAKVQATNGTFTESGLSLMMPPDYGSCPCCATGAPSSWSTTARPTPSSPAMTPCSGTTRCAATMATPPTSPACTWCPA